MKKILFLSHIYPPNLKEYLPNIKGGDMFQKTNANFELNFISALAKHNDIEITLVNQILLKPLRMCVDEFNFEIENAKIKGINIKQDFSKKTLNRTNDLFNFYKRNKKLFCSVDAIIFSTYLDAKMFKKILPGFKKKCLLLPDLPNFNVAKTSFKNSVFRKLLSFTFYKNIKHINYFFPITKTMKDKIPNAKNKKFYFYDGIYEEAFDQMPILKRENYIFYGGSLNIKYGILDLLNGYLNSQTKNKYELKVAGGGNELNNLTSNYNDIFLGLVKKEDCLKLEAQASLLIVPECGKEKYAKYSFHSKILEYLCSGTPTLLFYYEGIPKDLLPFCNLIDKKEDDNAKSISLALDKYLKFLDTLKEKAELGKAYIKKTRSKETIGYNVYNFLFK